MRKVGFAVLGGLAVTSLFYTASSVLADGDRNEFKARLNGFEEVPTLVTTGAGRFRAELDMDRQTISYVLSYSGLEGGPASAAHIHIGRRAVNGGVSAFLCGGGDKPPCPPTEGTVSGVIDPADVVGPAAQGVEPGSFAELVRAMRAGAAYVNVHTPPRWPGGEIRGQIRGGGHDDDD